MVSKKRPVIFICGLAGSGKSTVARMLARKFKLDHVSAGDAFRTIARERGMNLIELGRHAEKHPSFDRELDGRMLRRARVGGVVLDGRALAFLARKKGLPGLSVFLTVDPMVSARRVAGRDGLKVSTALAQSRKREREVARRLKKLYGLDTADASYYDVVIQTDNYAPREVVALIAQLVRL